MSGKYIADRLSAYRFYFNNEDELQLGIAGALEREKIPFEREAVLSDGDRIDFLCGGVGIEVKVGGSRADVIRQIHRYCGLENLSELILLTNKHRHAAGLGETLQGKPIHVVYLSSI